MFVSPSANNNFFFLYFKLPYIICIQFKRIHDFHNGGRSAEPGDNSMKTRSQRPQSVAFVYYGMASFSSGLHNNSSNAILLTEDDIPGASFLGREPEELNQ